MIKLFKYLNKKDILYITICLILVTFQVWLELRIPEYMSNITKLVETEGSSMNEIIKQGSYMLFCAIGSLISSITAGYFAALVGTSFAKTLRKSVFYKVQNFGMKEIKRFSTSSLITRTTNDITQIQMLIAMGLQVAVKAPITAVWGISKIAGKSKEWSMLTFGAVGVFFVIAVIAMKVVIPRFRKIQKLTDNINRVARENLKGIRVVKAYNAEEYQQSKFEKANNELTENNLTVNKIMAVLMPSLNFFMSGLTLGIYWIGAFIIYNSSMSERLNIFSDMIVFSSYSLQIIMAFVLIVMSLILYPRAQVCGKRILEVLETDENIKDGKGVENTSIYGKVEFKNVSFKYPDSSDYILKNISFVANPGETVAIIGATGSGKTSLINLIPRFYDVQDGEVLVDNINVKDYKFEQLYNKLGYISQKAVMFKGNVKDNVGYGLKDGLKPSENQIKEAIKIAQAEDFVLKFPKQYEAEIAQDGTNISGGQKQRLAIARAIARNPEIYIFDDSFSALDYKTDSFLRKELNKYTNNATNIIVGQRIGTIKNANKIIVLNDGEIVGQGTHEELMKENKIYKEIALSQLSIDELNI